jgi:hypothetical protein
MWQRVLRSWNVLWGRTNEPEPTQLHQLIPAKLLADLQKLIDDELQIRERKRRADRYQRAGATTGAALLASGVILLLISEDLSPKQAFLPTSGDSQILLATLLVTGLATVWNVLGWLGAREMVSFVWLNTFLYVAGFLLVLSAFVGVSLLITWSTGGKVPPTWAKDVGWGGLASSLLPLLVALSLANRTGFIGDEFDKAVSARPISWAARMGWYVYIVGGLVGLLSGLEVLNLTSKPLPSPEWTTAIFAIPYISSGLSLIAAVPLFRAARRRWDTRSDERNAGADEHRVSGLD